MDLRNSSRKEIGNLGENLAAQYLTRHGFRVIGRNIARKTGELDVIVRKGNTLHFIEVKAIVCEEFPVLRDHKDEYDPANNLHPYKIRKVARTAEWYVAEREWEGDLQIDAVLVWLRARDNIARVEYIPQIL